MKELNSILAEGIIVAIKATDQKRNCMEIILNNEGCGNLDIVFKDPNNKTPVNIGDNIRVVGKLIKKNEKLVIEVEHIEKKFGRDRKIDPMMNVVALLES